MNKKVMALAVAGAFATPAVALAQASNVQVFGTMYMEYAYGKQGSSAAATALGAPPALGTDLVNVDILQSPGSEVGIKGEEALGGGMTAWFQCASTADIRGGAATAGFCSRNSAIGVKGKFGNAFAGNWDMPMKRTAGAARMLSDTGIWGVGRMLFGDSSTFGNGGAVFTSAAPINTASSAIAFSRRQNASIFYDTPNFSGFQGYAGISTTTQSIAQSTASSGAKPRVWGVAGTYTNGPLYVVLGYENHTNFSPAGSGSVAALATQTLGYSGTDTGWQAGATYQFGPVKAGLLFVSRKYDMAANGLADLKINAWNIAGEWAIAGPHALRGGYTRAQNTTGSAGATGPGSTTPVFIGGSAGGGLVGNAGVGSTGANIWQVQYVYNASKRTEMTAGYVALSNDANARYSLGGLTSPGPGQNQSAFAVSIKNTF